MSEPVKIVITVEGGIVASICTLGVPVVAVVIDYDTESAEPERLTGINQGDCTLPARVHMEEAGPVHPAVMASIEDFWPSTTEDIRREPNTSDIPEAGPDWFATAKRIVGPEGGQ
jgi:hypothetical protein